MKKVVAALLISCASGVAFASKSFTSTGIGLAIAEGRLSLDDTVLSFFPEDAPAEPSDNLKAMRVRDLLAMSTGHHADDLSKFSFDKSPVPLVRAFLALPVAHKPGTHFLYNTPASYMLSAIVQKATGQTLVESVGATKRPQLVGFAAAATAGQAQDRFSIPASDSGLPGAGPIRRYDWFQSLWRERRSQWAGQVEQDRNAVVFLGDSITQGWGGGLGAAFPGMKVANRGISGDTTRGILLRLQDDVVSLDPAAVVLLAGTNDLEEGATPEVIAGNLELILAGLERHDARLPIVLCQVFPSSSTQKRPADRIKALNALYLAAAKRHPQVSYLESWPLFAGPGGDATAAEFPDLLHPNEAGYAKWSAALRPVFATLGFAETSADTFTPEEGFESLFNGRDLTGWGYRPTSEKDKASAARWQASDPAAAAWPIVTEAVGFDGLTATPDGRFAVVGGRLVVKAPREYRKIQQLWTTREFPRDFVLKLEFRATPNADSGVYVRGPQLQCRDYRLAGPYKELKRYKPQDWNEIVVTVKDGVAQATCNGELLEAALAVPGSGPVGVEGDRGQMEYRRIRVKMEPSP